MHKHLIYIALLALLIALPLSLHASNSDSLVLAVDDLLTSTHVVAIAEEGNCVPVAAFSQAVEALYDSKTQNIQAAGSEESVSVDPEAGIGTVLNNETYAPIGYLCMKMNFNIEMDEALGVARIMRTDQAMSHEAFVKANGDSLRARKLMSALQAHEAHWSVMAFDDRCWQNTFTLRAAGRFFVPIKEVMEKLSGNKNDEPTPTSIAGPLGSIEIKQDPKALTFHQFTISTTQPVLYIAGLPYLEISALKQLFDITWEEDPQTGTIRFLTGAQVPSFASFLERDTVLPTALIAARHQEALLFRTAYLTFDDGPSTVTPEILRILEENNVKATFFVLGKSAQRYPEILKQVADAGHVIGNHTYSHVYETLYKNVENFMGEVEQTNALLRKILGYDTQMVRAPYGSASTFKSNYYARLHEKEFKIYQWNVDSEDSKSTKVKAEDIVAAVRKQLSAKSEAVILFHDSGTKKETARALPEVIKVMREMGFDIAELKYETVIQTKGIVR